MIPVAGNRYVFEGSGYGHGVGLCQWGSQGLALEGHPYPGILNRYFPGSKLVRMNYGRAER
jgi:stage II sporulation protein D